MLSASSVMWPAGNTAPVPRILIANDQEWTVRSLESILAPEGYEVIRAYTGQQALDRAAEVNPDLIILDTQLPDHSGPEVCRRLRQEPGVDWFVPIILTTAGSNGRARLLEAMEAGAWDFATQPFDAPSLLARIRTYLRGKRAYDHARAGTTLDGTTGLYTQHGLAIRAVELAAEARRRREPLSCLVVSVSDGSLHEAFENLERTATSVTDALRFVVRRSDAVARLAALDFAVIAPNLDRDAALQVLARFQERLAQISGGTPSIRTGLTTLDPESAMTPEDLISRATRALEGSPAPSLQTTGRAEI